MLVPHFDIFLSHDKITVIFLIIDMPSVPI